jgi:hypothetical protein
MREEEKYIPAGQSSQKIVQWIGVIILLCSRSEQAN